MKKKIIGVVGAKGYVGRALCDALAKNPDYEVLRVTRDNYGQMQDEMYDILINSAMPSGRFWAKNNPALDYVETVQKTAHLLTEWKYWKFVQISTVSARCEADTVYGKHKAEAEKLCEKGENLIVRLSAMYSPDLSKGALVDMMKGAKVFVSGESRYPFAPLSFVASWISQNLDRKGLVEVGAKNSISLQEIASRLHFTSTFEGPIEDQSILNPEPGFPDASGVLDFLTQQTASRKP